MADSQKIRQLLDSFFKEIAGKYHNYIDYQIAVTRFFVLIRLLQYRLAKAKEMLEDTEMKVSGIAGKLRYNNSQNFIRSFRRAMGTTPGAYRDEYVDKLCKSREL